MTLKEIHCQILTTMTVNQVNEDGFWPSNKLLICLTDSMKTSTTPPISTSSAGSMSLSSSLSSKYSSSSKFSLASCTLGLSASPTMTLTPPTFRTTGIHTVPEFLAVVAALTLPFLLLRIRLKDDLLGDLSERVAPPTHQVNSTLSFGCL